MPSWRLHMIAHSLDHSSIPGACPCPAPIPLQNASDDVRLPACSVPGWLHQMLRSGRDGFLINWEVNNTPDPGESSGQFAGLRQVRADVTPEVRERYLGDLNRAYYLIRPDQIIAGRWPISTPIEYNLLLMISGVSARETQFVAKPE